MGSKKILHIELEHCNTCPYKRFQYLTLGEYDMKSHHGYEESWICKASSREIIRKSEKKQDKIEIPNWCPLPSKK